MAAMERFSKSQVADRSDSVPTTLHHLETRDASSLIFFRRISAITHASFDLKQINSALTLVGRDAMLPSQEDEPTALPNLGVGLYICLHPFM